MLVHDNKKFGVGATLSKFSYEEKEDMFHRSMGVAPPTHYYVTYWDGTEEVRVEVTWAEYNEAVVDATPAVLLASAKANYESAKASVAEAVERKVEEFNRKAISRLRFNPLGETVYVDDGRKVGTKGVVFWHRGGRVGIRTSDERTANGNWKDVVWTYAEYLVPANPPTAPKATWLAEGLEKAKRDYESAERVILRL